MQSLILLEMDNNNPKRLCVWDLIWMLAVVKGVELAKEDYIGSSGACTQTGYFYGNFNLSNLFNLLAHQMKSKSFIVDLLLSNVLITIPCQQAAKSFLQNVSWTGTSEKF